MKVKKVKKDVSKSRNPKLYCEKCGFKIRGKNHEEGEQHKRGKNGKIVTSMGF